MRAPLSHLLRRLWTLLGRAAAYEPVLYGLVAGAITLFVATRFYGSLKLQLLYAHEWAGASPLAKAIEEGDFWSAPLDDVFIHFDFARSVARARPFEWSTGGGYSSGGTSILYPFVLALGFPLGFGGLRLMEWAAIVACVSVFAVLLVARRLFKGQPLASSYLAPFTLLCIGALDWTLFSGMEVALFLAVWAGTFVSWDDLEKAIAERDARAVTRRAWALGLWGGVLTATRPEAAALVALFGFLAAERLFREDRKGTLALLARVALPGAFVVLAHALANRVFTGETTAAGALVKLEAHHPYFTREQVFDAWWFHLKYQVLRVTQYHLADPFWVGWFWWPLSAAAFVPRATRRYALLLWASALFWIVVVAFNGQVRWQNERYTMPALAWLLLAAAMGLGALLSLAFARERRPLKVSLAVVTAVVASGLVYFQAPRFREQVWFFGRASRNILEQHVQAGLILRDEFERQPRRVMVGDAGAIPYVSDLPALDIIGLGGFQGLPFARATRAHAAAGIELLEHVAPEERPDVLALYPSWWGDLPIWFGRVITEVPVRGNVICGGASKVLYRADWSALESSAWPSLIHPGERIADEIDVADILSEKQHRYRVVGNGFGYVTMKILPHPADPRRDLWDAGRVIAPGLTERFELQGVDPRRSFRLVARVAPSGPLRIGVTVAGRAVGAFNAEAADAWQELELTVPALSEQAASDKIEVVLEASQMERIVYHLWALQPL
jgi:hypothetical protein